MKLVKQVHKSDVHAAAVALAAATSAIAAAASLASTTSNNTGGGRGGVAPMAKAKVAKVAVKVAVVAAVAEAVPAEAMDVATPVPRLPLNPSSHQLGFPMVSGAVVAHAISTMTHAALAQLAIANRMSRLNYPLSSGRANRTVRQ